MKTALSLTELAGELERQQIAKEDIVVDTRKLNMVIPSHYNSEKMILEDSINPTLELEDQRRFYITDQTHRQIATRLDIPQKYYDRMRSNSPHLLADNVNHWFEINPQKRMVRLLDNKARAFLSDRYARIDNYDVANVVLPILQTIPGLSFKSMNITENRMYIKVVSTETRLEVKSRRVGDFVESGVIISNSEIGLGALSIEPFFHFLWCQNGMVRQKDGFKAFHLGSRQTVESEQLYSVLSDKTKKLEDSTILSKVNDVLLASMNRVKFEEAVHIFQQTTENYIDGDVTKTIEKVAETVKLTQTEQSSVLRHLIEGGDLSQYGLVNAITRTAEDVDSYDRATELEIIGGSVIDIPASKFRELIVAA